MRLMPKPIIDRVWIIRSANGEDQWVKARARLPRWRFVGNDPFLNTSIEILRDEDGARPVGLLVAGTPEPMPAISFRPGDAYEIQVAIWIPTSDTVHISRSLSFKLAGREPRLLSASLCYGLADRTPPLSDGGNKLRLRLTAQGRIVADLPFTLNVDHAVGFHGVAIGN